ncbi:hypothetical protein FRC03_004373 [Tulasnella sp. 419]|nr:hypothetical protein FRC03_004373 [Tulasnella sp. 419]
MWSKKCDARRKEQETGEFDVVEMYKRSKTEGNRMDVADFVGHVTVTTMESRGGGRAVVATQDLKAGELLVLAKPFASVFEEDFHGSQELHIVLNLITDTSHGKCHGYLISKIATILFGEPVKADLIYHLYSGPNFSKSPSRYPPDNTKPSSQHEDTPLFNDQVAVDVARIQAVASFNCFAPKPLSPVVIEERVKNKNKTEERLKRPSALYTFPSLFNHSCVPNCSQDFIGDVIVIRALQDISQGTELTLSYGNAGNTFEKRKEHLKKWFDKCDCALCEVERLDGAAACETRERVVAQIKQAATKPETRSSAQEAKRYLKEIQGTYRSSTDSRLPRIALYEAHFHLGNQLEALGNIVELVEEHIKGVRALGVNVIDDSISGPLQPGKRVTALPIEIDGVPYVPGGLAIWACLSLTTHFLHGFGDKIRAERWLRAARWMVNVMHGGGDELFKIMYEEQLDLWSILDFNRLIGP